ncbi:uncharacterized protein B0I36DRAFT_243009 [Microdochium trichocladiopsis]|uniref:Uncharacterized protein n=1 Tax=Microdochium trichocladiopsis TaxID=1682393 RepID=A0A9P9BNH0_9PEZI|nr:uncharacterized protein B0I36DRAFT_243009 [Microdochium trichocladiopsis]KAH7031246.1 hypothetical protein B0I36DRAFT_243009 [Microdochium trichocladiopsis]
MSAPAQGRDRKGLGKLLSRAKTVFKRSDGSRRASNVLATDSPQPTSTTPAPRPAPAEPTQRAIPEGATRVSRAQIQDERARRLGARFGIEFEPQEWANTEGDVLRIDKAPRMRIHRQCHKCQSGFGSGNECPSCKHMRCKQCIRNPPKRTEAEKEAARARKEELIRQRVENAPIIPSYDYSHITAEIILKRPSRATSGDLVFRPPRVRVRRNCHVCSTLITSDSKQLRTCDTCGHKRCDDCPRHPDARKKYPYGYPHDEAGNKFAPTHRCHECHAKFPSGTEDGAQCAKCAHAKCPSCPRVKPRKVDPHLNPEKMKELQARIAGLSLDDY